MVLDWDNTNSNYDNQVIDLFIYGNQNLPDINIACSCWTKTKITAVCKIHVLIKGIHLISSKWKDMDFTQLTQANIDSSAPW